MNFRPFSEFLKSTYFDTGLGCYGSGAKYLELWIHFVQM